MYDKIHYNKNNNNNKIIIKNKLKKKKNLTRVLYKLRMGLVLWTGSTFLTEEGKNF